MLNFIMNDRLSQNPNTSCFRWVENFDIEMIENMSTEDQLEQMYRIIDEAAGKNLNKRFGFSEKKRKLIQLSPILTLFQYFGIDPFLY